MTPEHAMAVISWETLRGPRPMPKSPYAIVFSAMIYCYKKRDMEAGDFLNAHLKNVREQYQ